MVLRYRILLLTGSLLVLPHGFALAQRGPGDNPSTLDLIQQLQPQTRGIRMPAEPPAAGSVAGSAVAPSATRPAAAPPRRVATTTAPPGVGAASLSIRFATGSAALTPEAARSLDGLGRALSSPQLAPFRFRIEGHTDTVGDAELNRSLSERRAATVQAYLATRHGVDAGRLEAVGLGESQLLMPTADDTAEPHNRRVQIVNLGG